MESYSEEVSLKTIHQYQLYQIGSYLEIPDLIRFLKSCTAIKKALYTEEGQKQLNKMLWRELGLTNDQSIDFKTFQTNSTSTESPYQDFNFSKKIYSETIKNWSPQIQRFFGFRTTGGIDDNHELFNCTNLFDPSELTSYCSEISPNIIVTGVLIKENTRNIMQKIRDYMYVFAIKDKRDLKQTSDKKLMDKFYKFYYQSGRFISEHLQNIDRVLEQSDFRHYQKLLQKTKSKAEGHEKANDKLKEYVVDLLKEVHAYLHKTVIKYNEFID